MDVFMQTEPAQPDMEPSVLRPELIETLQRYSDLFTFAPVGVVVLTEDGRVEDVNRAAASMLGWPRSWVAGQLFSRWVAKADVKRFLEHLRNASRSEQALSDEFRIKDRRGRTRAVRFASAATIDRSASGRQYRCQISMTDVTDQRSARGDRLDGLAHVVRLNSCGEMAAALAHELSQPLGAITLYCKAAAKSLEAGDVDPARLASLLERISLAASHANSTIHGLRSFLSNREPGVETLDINAVLREAARLAAAYAKERGCRIELRLAENLPGVRANRVHVQQVMLNLLQNGIDAMQDLSAEDRRVLVTCNRPEPSILRVTVADLGPGMTAEQRRRAFEPFFTTKKNGMGMGLSISRSIIESYGGRLWARRTRRGTALSFTLPANEQH
jgi:PAS domain S-box-containing protein